MARSFFRRHASAAGHLFFRLAGWPMPVLLIAGLALAVGLGPLTAMGDERSAAADPPLDLSAPASVHLYFADVDGRYLRAEERSLPQGADPTDQGRNIISALIEGPRSNLGPTLPEGTELKAFFIAEDRTAYADFSPALGERHPGGAHSELLTVYSIVNSLLLNLPRIETVKILIAGRESETLAGHVLLTFPYIANMLLIR
jgi:hypothetical protein